MSYANNYAYVQAPASSRVAAAVFAAVAESNNVVARVVSAVRKEYVRRATFRQLSQLDERTLSDIGLTRDSIRDAVDNLDV